MIKRWYGIYKDICVKYVLPISVVGFCWNWFGGFVRTSYMVNYQQGIDWDMERLQNHTEMSIKTFYYLAEISDHHRCTEHPELWSDDKICPRSVLPPLLPTTNKKVPPKWMQFVMRSVFGVPVVAEDWNES